MSAAALSINSEEEDKALTEIKFDEAEKKQLYGALVALSLEAARHDASEQEIGNLVEDRLTKERLSIFTELFNQAKSQIRTQLSRTSSSRFPTIVEVQWRLDHHVQNNRVEGVRAPTYFISLTVQDPDGQLREVEFGASLEELQDLFAKCKDAVGAVKLLKI